MKYESRALFLFCNFKQCFSLIPYKILMKYYKDKYRILMLGFYENLSIWPYLCHISFKE